MMMHDVLCDVWVLLYVMVCVMLCGDVVCGDVVRIVVGLLVRWNY